jgi:hypothetical protein
VGLRSKAEAMNITCSLKGHKWQNELGGYFIDAQTGASICYRCLHEEIRGDDPASWFDYPNGPDSYGELNLAKIPKGTSLRSGRAAAISMLERVRNLWLA